MMSAQMGKSSAASEHGTKREMTLTYLATLCLFRACASARLT
jgi:hypothetical protein